MPKENENDPLAPSATLLIKLGSAVVHADEYLSDKGHDFDRQTFHALLNDPEVKEWLEAMNKQALLPVKR
jgi:hypothetical protein